MDLRTDLAQGFLKPTSLAGTLDSVNAAFFGGRKASRAEAARVAKWITSRQGLSGSYANMFAPTKKDFEGGIRVFTGERITSRAAIAHILGEEACRALILLAAGGKQVKQALAAASQGLSERLKQPYRIDSLKRASLWAGPGVYCCGKCSVAFWRHLAVGGLDHHEQRLRSGLKVLRAMRDGKGKWRVFPFFYTLLALSEIDLPGARAEVRYAAGACAMYLSRRSADDIYSQRKRLLSQRILGKC